MPQCPPSMAAWDWGSGNSSRSVNALHRITKVVTVTVVPELSSSKIGIKSASCLHSHGQ